MQSEHFGVHISAAGDCVYGGKVDSVMQFDGSRVPVDLLSRVKMDLHEDSACILFALTSTRQRSLSDNLFSKNFHSRSAYRFNQFSIMISRNIEPKKRAAEYLDGEEMACARIRPSLSAGGVDVPRTSVTTEALGSSNSFVPLPARRRTICPRCWAIWRQLTTCRAGEFC